MQINILTLLERMSVYRSAMLFCRFDITRVEKSVTRLSTFHVNFIRNDIRRRGKKVSSSLCDERRENRAQIPVVVSHCGARGAKVPPDVPTSKCATDDALETRARPLENRTTKM